MRTIKDLHGYQSKAVQFQIERTESMLWLDCGLGKTVITLTSIQHLLKHKFLKGVLIVAPIRVVRLVWRQEALKWDHTNHLKFSVVAGTKDQRTRALLREADVYLINYENLKWMAETLYTYYTRKNRELPFNGIVWDEVSKCKNSTTQRVKAIKKILNQFKWITGLTGTPASNGYKDLHGQYLVVDKGQRLGTAKTAFTDRFYYRPAGKQNQYRLEAFDDTEERIRELIGDITLEMSAEDYNPLPDMIINDIWLDLDTKLRSRYEAMEKEFFLVFDSGKDKELFNKASLTNACLQFSNGAMYHTSGVSEWEHLHDLKLEALEDLIEESNGSPILCAYAYKHDAERIMQRFKSIKPINLTECKTETKLANAMNAWKSGNCQLLIGHPACLHGDTEVLTEHRGWVKITNVTCEERVFDGVEFVSHEGCNYSGHKEIISLFDIKMTTDHKLLVDGKWEEAKNVRDSEEIRKKALYKIENYDDSISKMFKLSQRTRDSSCRTCKEVRSNQNYVVDEIEQRDDRGRSSARFNELSLREKSRSKEYPKTREKADVYDLVNCGPRNRFLIRNQKEEMFISHNSMSHGIDGLQDHGHIMCWFGLNWSLDLYHQFNSRIRRQGQGAPVICHRIMTRDTLDEAQMLALEDKATTEAGLRNAIKQYRDKKCITKV